MTARDKADYDTAIKQFKKCIEADSGNVDAIYYLAWSYKNKGDSKNANKYFKEIYDNFPNSSHYDTAKSQLNIDDSCKVFRIHLKLTINIT